MPERTTTEQLAAELRLARRHAACVDAELLETQAQLASSRASALHSDANAVRAHAGQTSLQHIVDQVVRLCRLTLDASIRVGAMEQAEDTLRVIQTAAAEAPTLSATAWHSVWVHGNWRQITSKMTTAEREHAAGCVAQFFMYQAGEGQDLGEPDGLRWWRAKR